LEVGVSLELGVWRLELSSGFIYDAYDHPPRRASVIAHSLARRQAIRGNDHPLMQGGAVSINGDLRRPFSLALGVDRLADD
jgi:hypothetical protein